MNLGDLLLYTASEYLDDRTALVDGDNDSLWSDDFLVRQFNEAQRRLARSAWCIIEEGVSPAGVVVLQTAVPVYSLHESILRVYSATPIDQEWPMYRSTDMRLRLPRPYNDMPFDVNSLSFSTPGRPVAFSTDSGTRRMRVFRTPSAVEAGLQINLRVARLPITWLTLDNPDAEPEVPDDYHYLLTLYAAGRALTQPNVDGQQKQDGRLLLEEFAVGVKEARQDRERAEMSPATWAFDTTTSLLTWGWR